MLKHYNKNPIIPKRVVICGSSGFVGSALVHYFTKLNIEVLGCSVDALEQQLHEDDVFIMLSAITPDKTYGGAQIAFEKNMKIGEKICTVLKKKPCSQVIYFSSDAVYSYENTSISEITPPEPESFYGKMHLARENMFRESAEGAFVIVRSTQIYGAADTHNSYGPCRMLRSAIQESKIFLFNDGDETRDHIFIEDTVRLVDLLLKHRSAGLINAVTGVSVSFSALADKIKNMFQKSVDIISIQGDRPVTHRKFDIVGLREAFNNFIVTPLEEGLMKMHYQMCEQR